MLQTIRATHPKLLRDLKIIYDAEAVFALREIRRAEVFGRPYSSELAERMIRNEMQLAEDAETIATVSEAEAHAFRKSGFPDVRLVTHALPIRPHPNPFLERNGFLFVGRLKENDSPNVDSVLWFALKVMPLLREHLGDALHIDIAGDIRGSLLEGLSDPQIRFHGVVEDLADLYGKARVFIAPTRFSAGVPLKIYEAAAHGLPVVATDLLANQLGWAHNRELLAATTVEAFAQYCVLLHNDADLWPRLRSGALSRMQADHSEHDFERAACALLHANSARTADPLAD